MRRKIYTHKGPLQNPPTIFYDVPDSTVIQFCKLQHAWNGQAPLQNVTSYKT